MKRRMLGFIGWLMTALSALADEKMATLKVGGEVYSNVTITSVSATDIYFTHSKGVSNAKLKNLDPALQQHFHFNADKATAFEQRMREYKYQAATDPGDPKTGDPKVVMDKAIARVQDIVNQPVTRYPITANMRVANYPNGWFHPGAIKPDFKIADVRGTQKFEYDQFDYVTSPLCAGSAFRGKDLEFNSMTKYFYTDRSVPKKKLTEAEMQEINHLYRIIAECEDKLGRHLQESSAQLEPPLPPLDRAREFVTLHRSAVIGGVLAFIVLLLGVRHLGKRSYAS